jgi:hypothetical protein
MVKELQQGFHSKAFLRLYRKRLIRSVVRPFWPAAKPEKWLFVVGCYNSGTTLLADLINLHPNVSGLPVEGVAITSHLKRPEDFGWTYLWIKCKDEIRLPPLKDTEKARKVMRDWRPWFSGSATVFVEKSISNILRMGWLEENFRPAMFVAIIRNGYAVSEGIQRHARPARYSNAYYKERYPIELCAGQWSESCFVLHQEAALRNHLKIIRYEDLVGRPVDILHDLWNWLELPHYEIGFDKSEHTIIAPGFRNKLKNQNAKSISRLSPAEIEKIRPIIYSEMVTFGYDPDDPLKGPADEL